MLLQQGPSALGDDVLPLPWAFDRPGPGQPRQGPTNSVVRLRLAGLQQLGSLVLGQPDVVGDEVLHLAPTADLAVGEHPEDGDEELLPGGHLHRH